MPHTWYHDCYALRSCLFQLRVKIYHMRDLEDFVLGADDLVSWRVCDFLTQRKGTCSSC